MSKLNRTYLVMAAPEAAIHLARVGAPWTLSLADARAMGGRVKPGHDGEQIHMND